MTKFERFFIVSVLIYSVAILIFSMALYRYSSIFRENMERISDLNRQPIKMDVTYHE